MNDTFMKTKPVFPLLVSMALPNVISMLVNSLYNIVDSLFVARISEQAMTALSLVFPVQNLINAISIGFGIGINAQIALYLGAGDREKADISATHGMALSVLHGLLCTLIGIAIMPGFLRRFTADESLVSMGVLYTTIVFLFSIVNMANLAFEKMFQAVGRMKTTMAALIAGCVCNIVLDPVLIFGLGPVPALGIAGAALATNLGQFVTFCIYLSCYSTADLPVRLRRKHLRHFFVDPVKTRKIQHQHNILPGELCQRAQLVLPFIGNAGHIAAQKLQQPGKTHGTALATPQTNDDLFPRREQLIGHGVEGSCRVLPQRVLQVAAHQSQHF